MSTTPKIPPDAPIPERRLWPFFGVLDMLLMTGLMVSWSRRLGLRAPAFLQRLRRKHRTGDQQSGSGRDDRRAS